MKIRYKELIKDIQFNAFIKNDKIIQSIYVSKEYNEEEGGYELILQSKDAGEYELFITLNWYWATSDLNSGKPIPVLASSHIRHEYSPCDLTRSEIHNSHLPLLFFHPRSSFLILFLLFLLFIFILFLLIFCYY